MGLKIHLGCGKRNFPGFVNVDLADLPHVHHVHDATQLPMFADESAELIYASHLLEYFDRDAARDALREWRRILAAGGVLRLAVPDFPALASVYRQTARLDDILGPLYGKIQAGAATIYHKTTYDFDSLKALLEESGYRDVRRYDWRRTEHAGLDDHSQAYFPHMDKDHGIHVSLNVEAVK